MRSIIVIFIGVNMTEKDINTLIRLSRKLGRSISDEGTFEERQTKHLIIKWKYKGSTFTHKFPSTTKSISLNYQYSQLRKNLRASGLGPQIKVLRDPLVLMSRKNYCENFGYTWEQMMKGKRPMVEMY